MAVAAVSAIVWQGLLDEAGPYLPQHLVPLNSGWHGQGRGGEEATAAACATAGGRSPPPPRHPPS